MKVRILLLLSLSLSAFAEDSKQLSQEEVFSYQRAAKDAWRHIVNDISKGILSSSPEERFRMYEKSFMYLPAYSPLTPDEVSQIVKIRSEYTQEKEKLPKTASLEEQKNLLADFSKKLSEIHNQSQRRLTEQTRRMNINFSNLQRPSSPYANPGFGLNAGMLGFTCTPYNNYQFCISAAGVKYKRTGDSELGDRSAKVKVGEDSSPTNSTTKSSKTVQSNE